MFERFTDRARKVMALANLEAQRYNHEYIGTEHLLLGLIKEGSGVGAMVLKNLNVDLKRLRLEVEKLVKAGPERVTMGKLPQTPRAKNVIKYAVEEARYLNHNYVGTEHILLGLARVTEGVAAQVLLNIGLNLERIRSEVMNLLGADPDSSDAEGGRLFQELEHRMDLLPSRVRTRLENMGSPLVRPTCFKGRRGGGVRHIVMWRLKDEAEGAAKAENALRIKAQLEGLTRLIHQVLCLEVGINQNSSEAAYDVVLYSEFNNQADLEACQKHPEYVRVAEFIEKVQEESRVVDYTSERTPSRVIRNLLEWKVPVISPGVHDAASAKLFERMTGSVVQCSGYGMAVSACLKDESELTLDHNLKITRQIISGVQVPVVADGQDGYGETDQTADTVSQFVKAGVAGISLADYVRGGGQVITEPRMIEKIEAARRAAVAAGKPDLVIIARTDALGVGSSHAPQMEKVIHRANAYLKAGADVIFVAYVQTLDEARRIVREIQGPVSVAAGLPYNIRQFSLRDLRECGVAWVSLPSLTVQASLGGIARSMRLVHRDGGFQTLIEEGLLYPLHCEEESLPDSSGSESPNEP
jgi:2-methylisocitrate lyase-like PEP mutase family enzyme